MPYQFKVRHCIICRETFTGHGPSKHCPTHRPCNQPKPPPTKSGRPKGPVAPWLPEAKRLREAGHSIPSIAAKFGVSVQRVNQLLPGRIKNLQRKTRTWPTCSKCGGRSKSSDKQCSRCTKYRYPEAESARRKRKYQQRKEAGICTHCGKAPQERGVHCAKCADRAVNRTKSIYHRKHPEAKYYQPLEGGKRISVDSVD